MLRTRRDFVKSMLAIAGGEAVRAALVQAAIATFNSNHFPRKGIETMRNVREACRDPKVAAAMLAGRVPRNVLEMDPNPSPEIHSAQDAAYGKRALREKFSTDLRSVLSRETNPAEATDEIEKLVTQLLASVQEIHQAEITYLTTRSPSVADERTDRMGDLDVREMRVNAMEARTGFLDKMRALIADPSKAKDAHGNQVKLADGISDLVDELLGRLRAIGDISQVTESAREPHRTRRHHSYASSDNAARALMGR